MSLLIDIYKTQAAEHPDGPELQIDVAYGYGNLGDTELEQGDKAAALLDLRRAVDIARQFGAKDAGGVGAQMVVADALDDLAQIPGSGVSWAEVAARFQAMEVTGRLGDRLSIHPVRDRRAPWEVRRSSPPRPRRSALSRA